MITQETSTQQLDHYLFLLQDLIWKILEDSEESPALKKRFGELFTQGYPEQLQLPKAYLTLIAHLLHLEVPFFQPEQFPNGTALLDTMGWCESRQLPEPIELAQLGVLWMILGLRLKNEVLQRAGLKIAVWQVHLLDMRARPHLSLWTRAQNFRPSHLALWNYALFTLAFRLTGETGFQQLAEISQQEAWDPNAFAVKLLLLVSSSKPPSIEQHFRPFAEEMTVGLMKFSNPEMSFMAHLSGWNSGLFSYHKKEVAVVCGGPQVGPYDALEHFGICRTWGTRERPFQEMTWEKTAYHCHLKGWTKLFSLPLWLHLDAKVQAGQTTIEVMLQEKETEETISFVLFVKSPKVVVGGKHYFESGTLERYEGKAVPVELQGSQEKIVLQPDPSLTMQVIPLAGGDYFFGAEFLIAFSLKESQTFRLDIK